MSLISSLVYFVPVIVFSSTSFSFSSSYFFLFHLSPSSSSIYLSLFSFSSSSSRLFYHNPPPFPSPPISFIPPISPSSSSVYLFFSFSSSSSFACLSYSFSSPSFFSVFPFVLPPFPPPSIYLIPSFLHLLHSSISSFSTLPSFRVFLNRSAATCFKEFLLNMYNAPAVRWLMRLCGAPASSTCDSCYLPFVHSLGQTSLIKT